MKQLMEMKKQADRIKRELDALTVEVEEVRGIKIIVTGSQEFRSITVEENLVNAQRKNDLERELLRSMNAAVKKSQQVAAQRMASVMPGLM